VFDRCSFLPPLPRPFYHLDYACHTGSTRLYLPGFVGFCHCGGGLDHTVACLLPGTAWSGSAITCHRLQMPACCAGLLPGSFCLTTPLPCTMELPGWVTLPAAGCGGPDYLPCHRTTTVNGRTRCTPALENCRELPATCRRVSFCRYWMPATVACLPGWDTSLPACHTVRFWLQFYRYLRLPPQILPRITATTFTGLPL